jgi:hypothetical protein
MQIRFHCPTDRCVAIIEYQPLEDCSGIIRCPRCGADHKIKTTDSMQQGKLVDRCAVCGGQEMFVRKDFPQGVGLAIVIVFGIASIYFFRTNVVISWAILASAVLIDLFIYAFIGRVTTCYACRAEYRGCQIRPEHRGFDLATSEKYA